MLVCPSLSNLHGHCPLYIGLCCMCSPCFLCSLCSMLLCCLSLCCPHLLVILSSCCECVCVSSFYSITTSRSSVAFFFSCLFCVVLSCVLGIVRVMLCWVVSRSVLVLSCVVLPYVVGLSRGTWSIPASCLSYRYSVSIYDASQCQRKSTQVYSLTSI